MRKWVVACMVVFLMMLMSCGKDKEQKVIAEVNGKEVTQAQFDGYLNFKRLPADKEEQKSKLLDQYLEREALADAIEKDKTLDKAMLEAELREFQKEMLISRYFEKYLNDHVTDEAIKNYYNTHAADYEQKKVHVAHILIRTNKKMSDTERQAKLTTAQEAYSKIKAGGDFAKVAESLSEDKISVKNGGDLGWVKEGSIDPVFSKTVFAMEPGTVSEPFETQFGFHVVKMIEGPSVVKQPFEAVAGDIRYQLRNQAKQAEMERLKTLVKIKKNK